MKFHLVGLVILLLISLDLVSAEMVTLQNCVIDTGTYMLPFDLLGTGNNRMIMPSEALNNGTHQIFRWRTDANHVSVVDVYSMTTTLTNPDLQSLLIEMAKYYSEGRPVASEPVTKPYPGYIASLRDSNTTDPFNNMIVTSYIGAIDSTQFFMFVTTEEPSMATYILSNLKVIPKTQEQAAITQSVANRLK